MSRQVPKVLIVGRPNVGKSTLLNRILGQKRAITFDEPGVTRDVASYACNWKEHQFEILDSGGVFFSKKNDIEFQKEIEEKVQIYLDQADYVLFVVDCQDGLHPIDKEIAKLLRPREDDVYLVINKVDDPSQENHLSEFQRLGLGRHYPVSSINKRGIVTLMKDLTQGFPKVKEDEESFRIAFVGRPNVGKSSLLNAVFQQERVIVSDQAGTTRDSIEAYYTYHGKQYVFVDTAGIRKQSKIERGVEYYSVLRSQMSMDYADCIVIVIDVNRGLSLQDKKIINQVIEKKKNMIIFVNKWDLTEKTDHHRKEFENLMVRDMPQLAFFPIIFGSAKERHHIGQLLDLIPKVIQSGKERVLTSELNQFVEHVLKRNPPTAKFGHQVKIFYGTQADVNPPTFVFFVNDAKRVGKEYYRFTEKRIRHYLGGFKGNNLVIRFKSRKPDTQ